MNSLSEIEEKLREASCIGNEDLLRDVIQNGVDINSKNPVNGTALHWAAKRGHTSIASILMSHGAKTDICNDKGEKPVDIANSKEMILFLGGDPTKFIEGRNNEQNLPIVPNYIANPVFPYSGSVSGNSKSVVNDRHSGFTSQQTQNNSTVIQDNELVLKVRVANAVETDFIEVELPKNKLTFDNLLYLMCQELQVHTSLVTKVRKLPDTILRKDKDILRLKDFQEIELVLSNKYISESSRNYKPTVSPRNENIVY